MLFSGHLQDTVIVATQCVYYDSKENEKFLKYVVLMLEQLPTIILALTLTLTLLLLPMLDREAHIAERRSTEELHMRDIQSEKRL